MKHTWTAVEKAGVLAFVRCLPEQRIDKARKHMSWSPSATVEDIVDILSTGKEDFERLHHAFEYTKADVVHFFEEQVDSTYLIVSKLRNGNVEQGRAWLASYITQRWAGSAQELLKKRGRDRLLNDSGLRREWEHVTESTFNARSKEQVEVFLLRMPIDQLKAIWQKLTGEVDTTADKDALVPAVLAAAEGPREPWQLLKAMRKPDVRIFMEQHWRQIEQLNEPEASGYGDRVGFDIKTCYLFILWAWAHM